MRKSYLTYLKNKLRAGHVFWPIRQVLKWPAMHLGHHIKRPLVGPVHGVFFTTYACDLRCHFCDLPYRHIEYKKAGRQELSLEEKLQVTDDFAAIGTTGIGFTGGEPILDPATPHLIRRAVANGMLTHISSNGLAFQKRKTTEQLFDLGLHGTTISIDGANPKTHNAIRGSENSFDAVIGALQTLLEVRRVHPNKMSITTTTVITKSNYREIPALVDMLTELGVDQIGFMPVQEIGLDYQVDDRSQRFMVQSERVNVLSELDSIVDFLIDRKRATDRIENSVAYLKLFKDAFRGLPLPIRCYAGYNTIGVDSWGDIYPCFSWAEMRRSAGNIRHTPLAEFWRSGDSNQMRREASVCRDCYWNNQVELNLVLSRKRVSIKGGYNRHQFSKPVPIALVKHVESSGIRRE